MANDMVFLDNPNMNLPAHLQGVDFGVTKELMTGLYTGGNRIGLRNSRFRLVVNGIEESVLEENALDVIILGAAPAVSRIYYAGTFKQGEKTPPTCYSADGIEPADDVKNKQSDKCMMCPQNQKGSKVVDGQKFKACSYFRRVVVMLAGDTEDRRIFQLDVKAQGLFGENSKDGSRKNLNDYIKMVGTRGLDLGMLVTRVSFDLDSSVPKLMFGAVGFANPDEIAAVQELVTSEEVAKYKEVSMSTLDLSNEDTADKPAAKAQAASKPAAKPKPAVEEVGEGEVEDDVPMPTQKATKAPAGRTAAPASKPAAKPKPKPEPVVEEADDDDELADILAGLE